MANVPAASTTCLHVLDVAEAHIKALGPNTKGGSKYLLDGTKASWQDVLDILQRGYVKVDWKVKADIMAPS
jgi:UDP-glucose 4-epimerase